MSDATRLERRYRRLLACYPRVFRQNTRRRCSWCLMAGAGDGRRRPGLADSADLIRTAIWMRLRPWSRRPAPTVSWALGLMVLGAALELVALATVLATQGSLRSAIVRHFPHFTAAQWHAEVHAHVLPVEVGAPIAAVVWLGLAWANGRGHGWARGLFVGLFGLTSVSLLSAFAQHAATYAPADLIAGCVLWLVGLLALLLIFNPRSNRHYEQRPNGHGREKPSTANWRAPEHVGRTGGLVS